ncbi:MAG TPA: PDZ domain-containing protein [Stellaceae bacterium]|nr:PDZ domain-containing protein [Stellaceae bacterium]
MDRSGKLVAVAGLLLSLAACGPLATDPPPRATVNVVGDTFSKDITLEGLPQNNAFVDNSTFWMLRSFVNPQTRTAQHQIYVDWFFPGHGVTKYHAADDTARTLSARQIFKESCGRNCGQTDTVVIEIDETMLRTRALTGFQVKLSGNDGAATILGITPQMIAAQLQAEDKIIRPTVTVRAQAPVANPNARTPDGKPLLGITSGNMPFANAVVVQRVDSNTPAEAAGIRRGDMIVRYNGHAVTDVDQFQNLILETVPGTLVPVEISRGLSRLNLSVHM